MVKNKDSDEDTFTTSLGFLLERIDLAEAVLPVEAPARNDKNIKKIIQLFKYDLLNLYIEYGYLKDLGLL